MLRIGRKQPERETLLPTVPKLQASPLLRAMLQLLAGNTLLQQQQQQRQQHQLQPCQPPHFARPVVDRPLPDPTTILQPQPRSSPHHHDNEGAGTHSSALHLLQHEQPSPLRQLRSGC